MRALNPNEQEDRKRKILQYVIAEYVRTGKPVGSGIIATESRLGLSPATIRNILAELESEGMIMQPHTSAGRVPTDKGYRFYVDAICDLQRLAIQEQQRIQHEYESRMRQVEDLMSQTSKMLSALSNYTGFVVTPKLEKNIFSHIELVSLSSRRILVAMITQSGLTKNMVIETTLEIPRDQLRAIGRIINENFHGQTLEVVKEQLIVRLEKVQSEYRDILFLAKEIGLEIQRMASNEVFLDGTSKILALPDFTKTQDLANLFKMIEEKEILAQVLEQELNASPKAFKKGEIIVQAQAPFSASQKVQVRIGTENQDKALQNLSVVASTYQFSDRTVGMLGILGPKRMEYSRMIALVDYVSQVVNRVLGEFGEE